MDNKQLTLHNRQLSGKIKFMDIFNHRANEIAASLNRNASSCRGLFALLPLLLIGSFMEYVWRNACKNH